jgi:hypothetical protein
MHLSKRLSSETKFGGGCSSGSDGDTDGGCAGSASSNDARCGSNECSSSSPSVSSSEYATSRSNRRHKKAEVPQPLLNGIRPLLRRQTESNLSMSSDLPDFSSGATENKAAETMAALGRDNENDNNDESWAESITSCSAVYGGGSSSDENADYLEDYEHAAAASALAAAHAPSNHRQHPVQVHQSHHHHMDRKRRAPRSFPRKQVHIAVNPDVTMTSGGRNKNMMSNHHFKSVKNVNKPRILTVGSDVMAHVLTFLEPTEIISVLTMPLSKDWLTTFTRQSELWRVLCLEEPFKAQVENDWGGSSSSSEDDSYAHFHP